eukprot:gene13012-13114_t
MIHSTRPLLVFDLDGTLADTAPDLMGTLNFVLGQNGIGALPVEKAHSLLGAGARALLRRGFAAQGEPLDDARLERLFGDFIGHYADNIAVHSRLFPGVRSALDLFAAQGYKFAVCTNKVEALAVKLLDQLALSHYFGAICGQDSAIIDGRAVQKPDPRALFHTISLAGGAPHQAIMIGDSKTDIDTARAAHIPVIAVDFGYTDVPVSALGPDFIISHFDDLGRAVAHIEQNNLRRVASPA